MSKTYRNEKSSLISFPLGGIGAGCIGLAGNGRLIDWEIFNRPNKNSLNGYSHFAIKAEKDGKVIDTRVLHGDLPAPYIGADGKTGCTGFGWGPDRLNLCGVPHFRNHSFKGQFPAAEMSFSGEETFPGTLKLHAWNVFIPNNSKDSSLPAACFEIEITNDSNSDYDYTVVGALSNPFGAENSLNKVVEANDMTTLILTNSGIEPENTSFGELSISTDAKDISFQEYWYRGSWCDNLEIYWHDLNTPGKFNNRKYSSGQAEGETPIDTGHLAAHCHLKAGETKRIKFVITWHVPNCTNYWRTDEAYLARIEKAGLENKWKNYYATLWKDALDSAQYMMHNYNSLKAQTLKFQQALFSSSLPEVCLEAISANLSTLKTPTCLRLEDGTFYAWEGNGFTSGSCEGSCTHVWNYAQALPFLFPDLERSMRQANYTYCVDQNGGSKFRILLPLGLKGQVDDFRPCADGQFGDIIKAFRDWKISGDTEWLKELWPTIKKTIEYAWSDKNFDLWDPDQTGILHGRQHHTLDAELFGPNAWLTGYYLAALKATSLMAAEFGETDYAKFCFEIFQKGKKWADQNLFNGEYYAQIIDLSDKNILTPFTTQGNAAAKYWSEEHNQIKYQVAQGVEIDMPIAQWHSNLYGLGEIFDPAQIKSSLKAIHKYSFKKSMRNMFNPWRIYALNDEAATLICSYPEHIEQPIIPISYCQEDQGGYTYAAAIQMIQNNLIDEGLELIKGIRDRYDGIKRNPWNEIECGSNYARPMASYSLLNTYSTMQFDLVKGFLAFKPLEENFDDFRCFWSLDGAWGEIIYTNNTVELKVSAGKINLAKIDFAITPKSVQIDDSEIDFESISTAVCFENITVTNSLKLILN